MNNSISEIARIWQQTLKVIDKKLGERAIFDSFFANSYIQDIKGNTVTVAVGSATAERLLSSRYVDIIKDSLGESSSFIKYSDFGFRKHLHEI